MEDLIFNLADAARNWVRWREGKRQTLAGWLAIFAAQFLAGVFLAIGLGVSVGAPISFPLVFLSLIFAIGCGLSGLGFGVFYALAFVQIVNLILGFSLGVWPGSPAWWSSAYADWNTGIAIPKVVVIIGIVLPIVWAATCPLAHKAWIWVMKNLTGKLLSSFSKEGRKEKRRKESLAGLAVTEREAVLALKASKVEGEGLTVVSRSRVVREAEPEKETSRDEIYGSLKVDTDDEALSGLDETALKSRQRVDENGVIIDDDADDTPFSDPRKLASDHTSQTRSDAVAHKVDSEQKDSIPSPKRESLSSEMRNRLEFLATKYNQEVLFAIDEQTALQKFTHECADILLGLSDIEIAFLRSLPDEKGLVLAELALEMLRSTSVIDTSFEEAVEAGVKDFEKIVRPTLNVSNEEDDDPVISSSSFKSEPISEDTQKVDFVSSFSFDSEESAKAPPALSGAHIASLLSQAAFESMGVKPSLSDEDSAIASLAHSHSAQDDKKDDHHSHDETQESENDDGESGDSQKSSPSDAPTPEASESEAAIHPDSIVASIREGNPEEWAELPPHLVNFNALARRLYLVNLGIPTALVGELVKLENKQIARFGEVQALREAGELPPLDSVSAEDNSVVFETGGTEEYKGFVVVLDEKEATADTGQAVVPEATESVSSIDEASDGGSIQEDDQESDNLGADFESDPLEQEIQDESNMVEANVKPHQAHKIHEIMTDSSFSQKEKFDKLMELESEEGSIVTVNAVRSTRFEEFLSPKVAHDIKNSVLNLIRDFRDASIIKFGEIASEAEAKIVELDNAPYKVDAARLSALNDITNEMEKLLADDKPSRMATDRKVRLANIRGAISALEEKLAESAPKKKEPRSAPPRREQLDKARSVIKAIGGVEPQESEISSTPSQESEAPVMNPVDPALSVENVFEEKPWLDPSLGDIDVTLPMPEDDGSPEYYDKVSEISKINGARVRARKARDAFLEKEREKEERIERERRELELKSLRLDDIAAMEKKLQLREKDILDREESAKRREREAIDEKARVESEFMELKQEVSLIKDKSETFDKISSILGDDILDHSEAILYFKQNMQHVFEAPKLPERFAKFDSAFKELTLNKSIQRKMKASSISLQAVFHRDGSEEIPERLMPHRSVVPFYGATIFRMSADLLFRIAVDLDIEMPVPENDDSSLDFSPLLEACKDESESAFIKDLIGLLNASKPEFVVLNKAIEDNVHDFQEIKKLESVDFHDTALMKEANQNLKAELEESRRQLEEANEKIKSLNEQMKASLIYDGVRISCDAPSDIDHALKVFKEADLGLRRPWALIQVNAVSVLVGIRNDWPYNKTTEEVIEEINQVAMRNEPVIVLTNIPTHDHDLFSRSINAVIAFQPLNEENVRRIISEQFPDL